MLSNRWICSACRAGRPVGSRPSTISTAKREFSALSRDQARRLPARRDNTRLRSSRGNFQTALHPSFATAQARYQSTSSDHPFPADLASPSADLLSDPSADGTNPLVADLLGDPSASEPGGGQWYIGYLKDNLPDFGWGPTSMMEWLFEHIHVWGQMPTLCLSIIATAACVRLATMPLIIKASDTSIRVKNLQPQLKPLYTKMRECTQAGDHNGQYRARFEMKQLHQEHGIKMRKVAYPFVQMFIGFGSWRLMRNMADLPVSGMEDGGYLWFQNLAVPDPYMALPIVMAVSQHLVVRYGGETGASAVSGAMRPVLMWVLPLAAWFIVSWAPAALQLSFGTASICSLGTSLLLRNNDCRRFLGISVPDKSISNKDEVPAQPLVIPDKLPNTGAFAGNLNKNLRPSTMRQKLSKWVDDTVTSMGNEPGMLSAFLPQNKEQREADAAKRQRQATESRRAVRHQREDEKRFKEMRQKRQARGRQDGTI